MTRDDVRKLLAYAAAGTRDWAPSSVDVDLWTDLLGDLPYDDAHTALRQHAASTHHRPVPADIRAGVKRLRADRLDRTPDAVPDADPDQPVEYVQALRDGRVQIADGRQPRDLRALTGVFPSAPPADWRPQLPARSSEPPRVLPPVDDPARLEQARAEIAAREVIPLPDEATS